MDLDDIRRLTARELVDALDDLGIEPGWAIGDDARAAAAIAPDVPALPEPNRSRNQAFQNLVEGTLTERVFRDRHLALLEEDGFDVVDYHEAGENRDFGVQRDGLELPINVKVASTIFRNALSVVGLDPEDCIPISAYKAIGSSERVHDLVYVDLVDFTLRERVDAYVDSLVGSLAIGWHLLSWYGGRGAKRAQNQYLRALFDRHGDVLDALVPEAGHFRVISALRVLAVMRRIPRRVPGLGIKAAGTGIWKGEVDVHVSVKDETRPWTEVADELRRHGIQHLLDQIGKTISAEVPDPQL
jgi:hypothetical protein